MDKEIVKNLEKNDYIKGKIKIIDKLIEKNNYKEAYMKFVVLLEYINIKYIKAKYNIDMPESSIMKIAKVYREKDKTLEDYMKVIDVEYNEVNLDEIEIEDIEYLASIIELIYKHMIENIGEFI